MRTWLVVAATAAALLAVCAVRHNDDSDAQLYSVVARHMVRDDTWTALSYAPNVHLAFREHLPFGFWPGALAVRLFGEGALPWVGVAWTIGTLLVLASIATRLGLFAPLAVLLLVTTEEFVVTNAAYRLDPALVCLALLAARAALVDDAPSWRGTGWTLGAATLAVAIKGPFGLVPLVCAAVARALVNPRSAWRWLPWGAVCTALACLPLALFLASSPEWRQGWLEQQVLASALGTRTDGETAPYYPLIALGAHCWPWLPLALAGLWVARPRHVAPADERRVSRARLLAWWLVLMLAALALPTRKLWHHTLLVFPACALLGAEALEGLRARFSERRQLLVGAMVGAAVVLFVAANARGRAAACTTFAPEFAARAPSERVLVMRHPLGAHWREISTLAFEHRLAPWLVGDPSELTDARVAMVPTEVDPPAPWRAVSSGRGWKLLVRDAEPR